MNYKSVMDITLTEEQRMQLGTGVEAVGRARSRAMGQEFRADDFLAGAMAMFHLIGRWDSVPFEWTYGFIAGINPLTGQAVPEPEPELTGIAKAIGTFAEVAQICGDLILQNGEELFTGQIDRLQAIARASILLQQEAPTLRDYLRDVR